MRAFHLPISLSLISPVPTCVLFSLANNQTIKILLAWNSLLEVSSKITLYTFVDTSSDQWFFKSFIRVNCSPVLNEDPFLPAPAAYKNIK